MSATPEQSRTSGDGCLAWGCIGFVLLVVLLALGTCGGIVKQLWS